MALDPIRKTARDLPVAPHLGDYARAARTFTWEEARRELAGLPGGRGLDIAHEAVDRHAAGPLREALPALQHVLLVRDGPADALPRCSPTRRAPTSSGAPATGWCSATSATATRGSVRW